MPKVSVIVPAFNAEKYLARCLDSLIAQTMGDFEAVVVDDGSTDGTWDICLRYADSDDRIRVFQKENGGVSSARNYALKQVAGEWVCFLDADDEFPEYALDVILQYSQSGKDMIMGGYEIYNERGEVTYNKSERIEEFYSRDEAVKLMYRPKIYGYLGYVCGKYYKLSIIRENGLAFDEHIFFNEDRLFATQYICVSNGLVFFTEPVYKYNEHNESAMLSLDKVFNAKFMTDIDGYIGMKNSIVSAKGTKENIDLADEGILFSFFRIRSMLKRHHQLSLKRNMILLSKLWRSRISPLGYVKFLGRVISDKMKK